MVGGPSETQLIVGSNLTLSRNIHIVGAKRTGPDVRLVTPGEDPGPGRIILAEI